MGDDHDSDQPEARITYDGIQPGRLRPRRVGPLAEPFAGWHLGTILALVAVAAAAWALTGVRMAGMDAGPGTDLGALGFYLGVWVAMMAAMMFPSVAPMVATFVGVQRHRRSRGRVSPAGGVACFLGGYVLAWTGAGLLAYGAFALGGDVLGEALAWERGGRWAVVAVLVAAAAYELTPLKHACLARCRGPYAFLTGAWREGRGGAARMGLVHGAWCIGCCWALMAALFALGVMSIAWMALVALLIAIEKLLPWAPAATAAVTVTLLLLAGGVAVAPERVPGLTVPVEMGTEMNERGM